MVLEDLARDAHYGLRQFRRTPILATIVTLSLALGIGANTAIFSAIETVMFRQLPVQAPEQLSMLVWSAKNDASPLVQDLEGDGGRSIGPSGSVFQAQSFSYSTYDFLRAR